MLPALPRMVAIAYLTVLGDCCRCDHRTECGDEMCKHLISPPLHFATSLVSQQAVNIMLEATFSFAVIQIIKDFTESIIGGTGSSWNQGRYTPWRRYSNPNPSWRNKWYGNYWNPTGPGFSSKG
ncbi:hypothetical protein Y032_0129g1500 [Ancylostoma ceylanicum]|uniref:Uncharacterized protein n=1 Tax=Ancylostoma ceylanicum TaxID=53326 RepID=A0A016T7V0_9BILA|nr:hypothetical protein Y032_0129g1500 [Ancylostoma ceylanicum]